MLRLTYTRALAGLALVTFGMLQIAAGQDAAVAPTDIPPAAAEDEVTEDVVQTVQLGEYP